MEYVHINGAKSATGMSEATIIEKAVAGNIPYAFRKVDKRGKPHFWYIPASWVIQNIRDKARIDKLKIEQFDPPETTVTPTNRQPVQIGDQVPTQADTQAENALPSAYRQAPTQVDDQAGNGPLTQDEGIPLESDFPASSIPVASSSDEEPPPPTPQPARPQDARDKYIGVLEELVKERKKEVKEVAAVARTQGGQTQPQAQPVSTPSAGGNSMAGIKNIKLYYSDKQSGELVYLAPLPFFPDDPLETIRKMVSDPGYYVIEWEQIGSNNVWFKHNKEFGPLADGMGTLSAGRAPMRPMAASSQLQGQGQGQPGQPVMQSESTKIAEKAAEVLISRALEQQDALPADASAYKEMADKTAEMYQNDRKRQEEERELERERARLEREAERDRTRAESDKFRDQAKIDQEMMLARMEKQASAEKESLASIMKIMETAHTQRLAEQRADAEERARRDGEFFKSMIDMEQGRSKEHIEIQTKIIENEKEKLGIMKENNDRFFGIQREILEMQKKHIEEIRALQDRAKPWEFVAQAVAKIADKVELKVGQGQGIQVSPSGQLAGGQPQPPKQLPAPGPEQPKEEQPPMPVPYTIEQLRQMTDEQLIAEVKESLGFAELLGYVTLAASNGYNHKRFLDQILDKGGNSPGIRFKVRAITRMPDIMKFWEPPFAVPMGGNPAEQSEIERVMSDQLETVKTRGGAWLAEFCKVAQKWAAENPEFF